MAEVGDQAAGLLEAQRRQIEVLERMVAMQERYIADLRGLLNQDGVS